MRLPALHKPTFTFHFYRDWQSWAVAFSLTMANAGLQLGPFWLCILWRKFW